MTALFNIDHFISQSVTGRTKSLLSEDLLRFHDKIQQQVQGQAVLVIGGAGTIGSSYIKALLRYAPGKLVVVDINENGLTELVRDCRSQTVIELPSEFYSYPIDFGSPVFKKIFTAHGPFDIVANFAAHKHVRSEKDVFSIEAMIQNNVIKAKGLLDVLSEFPPQHFFCVSTDKAANPVNIMGASKKLMEELILSYKDTLKITTARFANVAFSNGSLLAGFMDRIFKHQPLSCPYDVQRYFVSPEESGQICLLACLLGESGDVFFPKLNMETDLIYFKDVAKAFLLAWGFEPEICHSELEAKTKAEKASNRYPLFLFESQTSGEKLYEEFYTPDEILDIQSFSSLGIIKNAGPFHKKALSDVVKNLDHFFSVPVDKAQVVEMLTQLLPHFSHVETGINLDQKM